MKWFFVKNKEHSLNIFAGLSALAVAIVGVTDRKTLLNKEYFKLVEYCVVMFFIVFIIFIFRGTIYTTIYETSIEEGHKKWFAIISGIGALLLFFAFELWVASKM